MKEGYVQPITPLITRYQTLLLGHCYFYNDFGHKPKNCRTYARDYFEKNRNFYKLPKVSHVNNKPNEPMNGKLSPFGSFIEFYKCHNYGHKAQDCKC